MRIFSFILVMAVLQCGLAQGFYGLLPEGENIIHHTHYSLSYSEQHEQAEWVMYELTATEAQGAYSRTDDFRPDPAVATGSAELNDYKGSGYDRGHLAPAGDMAFSVTSMTESFYLSNMSPQEPSFNRGGWRSLEGLCRAWALEDGELYIVTGPVLSRTRGKIGVSGVSVPAYYYKIVFDIDEDGARSIAFLMPNTSIRGDLQAYIVSVDSIEKLSGIDFFPALPDQVEDSLEAKTTGSWNFHISTSSSQSASQQCWGTTLKGDRCRRRTTNTNGYCWQHTEQAAGSYHPPAKKAAAVRCKGMAQDGRRCRRTTRNVSGYCWQHE